jgi:release factor glutamine methyltransferase
MAEATGRITWRELWNNTADIVGDRIVARWLCETASGCDSAEFTAELSELVSARSGLHLDSMVRRVLDGEPVQYVMGRWAFRHLDLMVDSRVLIPRPETELLVDHVIHHVAKRPAPHVIADLGTGSGAIGLSLLQELPLGSAEVWMTDVSLDALDVARANAAGIGRPAASARFGHGSWCEGLPNELQGSIEVVVSNPPYIASDDPEIDDSVCLYEPHTALFSGSDGLHDIRVLTKEAVTWLSPGGMLIVEMGYTQAEQVRDIFVDAGFVGVVTHSDLAEKPRFTAGFLPR